ncbi:hect-domain-containing protein [Vairimorpha ceranae]|uniref:HECT-type E3 ubiquitin transferase n=1 Tax=Vairimorpha ceranae TaxID=40302 RepID=A0A0F9WCK4_9MICR|nr:hect-domain-containing protein [Vairimorpha ceranae]KAF5140424.1 hypothetical protein G9O61_00g014400 [Vairimorpha ceranae]KAF5141059.1 hypothetical protein G9O61_00g007500 [Vairimorpha ceranae]KKO75216.1 hect-domain-containing protein [Vairimorpha ceranae]
MKLILTRIQSKQKGWFSWLFTKNFNLKINNETFLLKTGNIYLGYIIEIFSLDVNLKIDIDNIMYDYSKTFTVGESYLEVDNPCFKGVLFFTAINGNFLTFLENQKAKCNTTKLSRLLQNCTDIHVMRLSYEKIEYHVNKENYTTSLQNAITTSSLPLGWETAVYKKRILYVNHNIKLCYWKSPGFIYNVLREKIDHFENNLLNLTFLSLRTLTSIKLEVRRGHILDSTVIYILQHVDKLKTKKLHASFIDEIGQDYGALMREFIYETSLEILNDPRLEVCNDFVDVKPNDFCNQNLLSETVKEIANRHEQICEFTDDFKGKNRLTDEAFYIYLGVFIALLLICNENIDYTFSLAFYENLLLRRYTMRLIQDVQYQKSLNWMCQNEVTEDILPGVTSTNKSDLIYSIFYDKLFLQKKVPYDFISKGFYSVIPEDFRDMFESDELSMLISNNKYLEVSHLKEFVLYNLCSESTEEIIWLWEILKSKDQIFLRKFLKFITGSGSIPMLINNSSFKIVIEQNNLKDSLLRASACLNKLVLSKYSNKQTLEEILDFSILNTEGFHKV